MASDCLASKQPSQAVSPAPAASEPRNREGRNHWFQQERDLQRSSCETELRIQPWDLLPLPKPNSPDSPSATLIAQR